MSNTISTYGSSNYLINQITQLEAKYSNATTEEASGLQSSSFSGIAGNSQQLLDLETQYSQIVSQTSNSQTALDQINETSSALTNISSVITSALGTLSAAISETSTSSSSATQGDLQSDLSELVSALNTQYAGSYLFSGSATSTAPVNTSASGYTNLTTDTANTSYYQGNETVGSVQVNNDLTISYGVTADNTSFEQALRALTVAAANPDDTTTLQAAYGLLQDASTGVSNLSSETTAKYDILNSQITNNSTTLTNVDDYISNLSSADLSKVSVQLSDMQNQLEASYSALADLLKLNLSDYLK